MQMTIVHIFSIDRNMDLIRSYVDGNHSVYEKVFKLYACDNNRQILF